MIAIIGNPNVGKTTFLNKINKKGYSTFETDAWVSRQYNNSNSEIYKKMFEEFGDEIIVNQKICKKTLKKLINYDFYNLRRIELIVHPFIFNHLSKNKYDFVEIPIIKWSPIDFTVLFKKIIKLKNNLNKNKLANVDNFTDALIDTNKRVFRTFETVDIYAKNITNVEKILKKHKIIPL